MIAGVPALRANQVGGAKAAKKYLARMARCETGAWRNRGDDRTILASLPQISGDRRPPRDSRHKPQTKWGATQIMLPGLLRFVRYRPPSPMESNPSVNPAHECLNGPRESRGANDLPTLAVGTMKLPVTIRSRPESAGGCSTHVFGVPPGAPIRTAVERRDVPGGSPAFPGSSAHGPLELGEPLLLSLLGYGCPSSFLETPPMSWIISMGRGNTTVVVLSEAISAISNSPLAWITLARRSRSATAWRAIARRIASGSSTSFTSTSVTFTPQGLVRSSMIFCRRRLISSRATSSSSRSAWPMTLRSVVWATWDVPNR